MRFKGFKLRVIKWCQATRSGGRRSQGWSLIGLDCVMGQAGYDCQSFLTCPVRKKESSKERDRERDDGNMRRLGAERDRLKAERRRKGDERKLEGERQLFHAKEKKEEKDERKPPLPLKMTLHQVNGLGNVCCGLPFWALFGSFLSPNSL